MNLVSWVYIAAARVTAAASLGISETARGGEKKDWGNSSAPYKSVTTIELVGLPKKVKCLLFFIDSSSPLTCNFIFLVTALNFSLLSHSDLVGVSESISFFLCC